MIRVPPTPALPTVKVSEATAKLEALSRALDAERSPDGTVDLAALKKKIAAAGEAEKAAFSRLSGAFERQPRAFSDLLRPEDVRDAKAAIALAKTRVGQFDENGNGQVDWGEARSYQTGDADLMAREVVGALRPDAPPEVVAWSREVGKAGNARDLVIAPRQRIDKSLARSVYWMAETRSGAEALLWALRARAVDGVLDVKEDDEPGAYTNFGPWLRERFESHPPLLALFARDERSLSDAEIAKAIGSSDFASFVAHTQAAITAKVGAPHEEWLMGADLVDTRALSRAFGDAQWVGW